MIPDPGWRLYSFLEKVLTPIVTSVYSPEFRCELEPDPQGRSFPAGSPSMGTRAGLRILSGELIDAEHCNEG